jgi:curved DNA-binding protein CbpA
MPDLYSTLGLSRRASSADIRAAYRALAKQSHPDVAGSLKTDRRIREINRAYETLGDPEMRAAYDRKLAHLRARRRRNFLSAFATGVGAGAVALLLTITTLSVTLTRKQNSEASQLPGGQPTLPGGTGGSERFIVKPLPEDDRVSLRSTWPGESEGENAPSDLATSPPAEVRGPSTSTNSERASPPLPDTDAPRASEPASQPSPVSERPSHEEGASAPSSAPTREVPAQQTSPELSAPSQGPGRQAGLAAAAPPDAKLETPPAAASGEKPAEREQHTARHGYDAIKRLIKKSNERTTAIDTARTAPPNRRQDLEQEPRLVSTNSGALRWPSADEPFVNMGGR